MTTAATSKKNETLLAWVRLGATLLLTYFIGNQAKQLFAFFSKTADAELLIIFFFIALLCALSFIVFYITSGTGLPSFVIAIFFGIAAQALLEPIVHEHVVLGTLVGFGATLILFGGGLETPYKNFKKLIWKILSLSFPGLLLTAFLFSIITGALGLLFNIHIPIAVAVLLGAVLASTDPAAIIPVLKQLRFHNRDTKDIIVSESAVTDVTGTLLTVVFLSILLAGQTFTSIISGYSDLFTGVTGMILLKQIFFGILFGVFGYYLLETLTHFKKGHEKEFEADAAFFLFVPVIIFTLAMAVGGSGYLAAFIAGLLFMLNEKLHDTERFFNHTIDGFLKPTIFLILGALVDPKALLEYAGVGILCALAFMFIIRPITVFLLLGPFSFFGNNRLGWRELVFISFIRETGAIPAVLLVTIASLKIPGMEGLLPIGMWVILLTLIIGPALTPWVAKRLKIASFITDDSDLSLNSNGETFVALGSRGHSFVKRLPHVVDWASKHHITKVVLLHCLEDRYTAALEEEIQIIAEAEFLKINKEREDANLPKIKFILASRRGFLQQNIDELSKQSNITAIFVGRKVLDFRLAEIKQLSVPIFFLD